jgi:hypothetical protein
LNRPVFSTLTILFLALLFPVFGQENNGAPGSGSFSSAPYKVGERLTYIVSYSNFPAAAHMELQVVSRETFFGRDAIQLFGHAETTEVINVALLAINTDYTTFVDPVTGLPFRSQHVVRDAIRSHDTFHELNQPAGTVATTAKQTGVPGTYDFLSAFYRVRALPLSEGASYNLTVQGEAEEYQIEVRVNGRQSVKTNVGSFNAIVTQVRVLNNSRVNGYRIKVLFSDDERHVPVLMTAKVGDGEIRAELAGSTFVEPPAPTPTPTPAPGPAATPRPTPVITDEEPPARNENWPFTIGEQLNYQIYVGNIESPAGVATFQVKSRSKFFDKDGLMLTVKAQTTGAVARLFVANDQINTYVDPKALLPYRTELNLVEGQRRKNEVLTINQERGAITTNNNQRIEIPIGTHDYLSFFYAVRTFNLAPPRRNAISLLVENGPKTLFISSLKREIIELGQQKISTIALSLTTDDPESDKYQLRMWVSDDRRRLPLRITAKTEIGPLRADLVILPTNSQ